MATYTVIQDIEAEDKFLGPLTLKQFIFGAAGLFFAYLGFFALTKGVPVLLLLFLPPALLGFFLAIPWSSEQPTETWVLAKLRFRLKPKARIWNQSGMEELVTITVPKVVERQLTDGLKPHEVQSRLKALAETIDTRGWAVKNATLYDTQSPIVAQNGQRLINLDTLPHEVPDVDLNQYQDVLDEDTAVSENFDSMINTSSQLRRQQSLDKMDRIRHGEPLSAVQQPEIHFTLPPVDPSYANEQDLSAQLRGKQAESNLSSSHMHQFRATPTATASQDDQAQTQAAQDDQAQAMQPPSTDTTQPQAQMTNASDPAILNLAQNNDWTVDTIARNAKKDKGEDEVVISLR